MTAPGGHSSPIPQEIPIGNMTNLAVFVSGNGSNAERLIRHFAESSVARVVLVVSNRPDAYALQRAERLGVPARVLRKAELQNPVPTLDLLAEYEVQFIVLAGFLLQVPDYLLAAFPRAVVNLHPALLPKFGGKGMWGHHVHEAVKAAGERETGMTVHWVNGVVDGGEIIAQRHVAILPSDTPDDIAAKEHELEMAYFPSIVEEIIKNR